MKHLIVFLILLQLACVPAWTSPFSDIGNFFFLEDTIMLKVYPEPNQSQSEIQGKKTRLKDPNGICYDQQLTYAFLMAMMEKNHQDESYKNLDVSGKFSNINQTLSLNVFLPDYQSDNEWAVYLNKKSDKIKNYFEKKQSFLNSNEDNVKKVLNTFYPKFNEFHKICVYDGAPDPSKSVSYFDFLLFHASKRLSYPVNNKFLKQTWGHCPLSNLLGKEHVQKRMDCVLEEIRGYNSLATSQANPGSQLTTNTSPLSGTKQGKYKLKRNYICYEEQIALGFVYAVFERYGKDSTKLDDVKQLYEIEKDISSALEPQPNKEKFIDVYFKDGINTLRSYIEKERTSSMKADFEKNQILSAYITGKSTTDSKCVYPEILSPEGSQFSKLDFLMFHITKLSIMKLRPEFFKETWEKCPEDKFEKPKGKERMECALQHIHAYNEYQRKKEQCLNDQVALGFVYAALEKYGKDSSDLDGVQKLYGIQQDISNVLEPLENNEGFLTVYFKDQTEKLGNIIENGQTWSKEKQLQNIQVLSAFVPELSREDLSCVYPEIQSQKKTQFSYLDILMFHITKRGFYKVRPEFLKATWEKCPKKEFKRETFGEKRMECVLKNIQVYNKNLKAPLAGK
ncbi:hypothetical protein HMI54_009913 [Coelomomyces lativittatus]|nr:hypothetical protein HMI56_002498 [Coelomomyces lativittatus]KAJ1516313.1 hypothetical protein HMI54_009913 [Coelomomyces lativittatus]